MGNDQLAQSPAWKAFQKGKYWRLGASIVIDLLGMATFLVPGVAEVLDLAWAPVAGIAHFALFRSWPGAAGGLVTLAEELLPVTDWIPSVTLGWIFHYVIREKRSFKRFLSRRQDLNELAQANDRRNLP